MQTPDLRRRVEALDWYHTLELAPGLVTDGMFDLRPYVGRYGIPERLDGNTGVPRLLGGRQRAKLR